MANSGKERWLISVEGRAARQTLVVVIFAVLLLLAVQLRALLVDIVIAITLASAIAPLAAWAEKRRVPRIMTVILTYIAVSVFYAVIGYLLWQPITEQLQLLVKHLPDVLDRATSWYTHSIDQLGLDVNLKVTDSDFRKFGTMALNKTLDASAGMLGVLLNAVLVLFLAAYFVTNANSIWRALLSWLPPDLSQTAAALIEPLGARMGGYVRGQVLVSTAVASFFAIGLSLIGVKYALVLGLMAGVLNLVPFVGSLITTALAVVIAFNQSLLTALLTLALFVVEQTIESNFIVPYLLGSQVELDPLVVLLAIIIGGTIGGAIGALIAVPISGALLFLAREFYWKPLQQAAVE